MGVNGLWELLEPAATEVSITALALADRYHGAAPHVPYVIGVDASGWFEQCQQQTWYRANPRSGQNPPLRSFIFRLARLARLPVHIVFCYDGSGRPSVKRGKQVVMSPHWMTRSTQRVLDAFGIPWFTAPGEAEAQLALMNKEGVIDAIMTDDSDSFVFGACTVLRSSSWTANDLITMYTSDAIKEHVASELHDEAFTVVALCCGGDYDKGLHRCGSLTALGLVRCGVGDGLRRALMYSHSPSVQLRLDIFDDWRQELRDHLACDPSKKIGRLHPSLAAALPDSFPPLNAVKLYLEPVVAPIDGFPIGDPQPPDVRVLAPLMQELLGWEDRDKILDAFRSVVWPAVVLKEILLDLRRCSSSSNEVSRPA